MYIKLLYAFENDINSNSGHHQNMSVKQNLRQVFEYIWMTTAFCFIQSTNFAVITCCNAVIKRFSWKYDTRLKKFPHFDWGEISEWFHKLVVFSMRSPSGVATNYLTNTMPHRQIRIATMWCCCCIPFRYHYLGSHFLLVFPTQFELVPLPSLSLTVIFLHHWLLYTLDDAIVKFNHFNCGTTFRVV